MKKLFLSLLCLAAASLAGAQTLSFRQAKFHTGDNMEWARPSFDDSTWKELGTLQYWDYQGYSQKEEYAWYRIRFVLPKSMLDGSSLRAFVNFYIGKVDDAEQTYLNGHLIGQTGSLPGDEGGFVAKWGDVRSYRVPVDSKLLRWDAENVIAVRAYNGGGNGGIYEGPVTVSVPDYTDVVSLQFGETAIRGAQMCTVAVKNGYDKAQRGTVELRLMDPQTGKVLQTMRKACTIKGNGQRVFALPYSLRSMVKMVATYTEGSSGKSVTRTYIPKYILTPDEPEAPRLNNAGLYGVRVGSPVVYRIPASGVRPMTYAVKNLPAGLTVDAHSGVISGKLAEQGDYVMTLVARNGKGSDERQFTIRVGNAIALTPAMGWNSWNCWGLSVSQEKVMASAKALIDKGLADYGYSYVNVDDAWQAAERNADGTIRPNERFPDMAALGRWLHGQGLKFGIYSSPGDYTCGHYIGSLDHERQDAATYNAWGVDYLKYDWCGYSRTFDAQTDQSVAAYVRPYLKMEQYLREQPRDIFYSLCQYGMADVWRWGHAVDANSWRTTPDITDTWNSILDIGFARQRDLYPYAEPGHWNDPDMLVVGKVGWGSSLRDSRLTPDEQYSHISLWSLLASSMLIGCDVSQIDAFTKSLLCNSEVIAINQDALGRQARQEVVDGDVQIWCRELADGSRAVGMFNLGSKDVRVDFGKYLAQLGMQGPTSVRDVWRQQDLSTADLTYFIPSHGVKYVKLKF